MMTPEELNKFLSEPQNRDPSSAGDAFELIAEMKAEAVNGGEQDEAKRAWCLGQILRAQRSFERAFDEMRQGEFYKAWCTLEQTELALKFLKPHFSAWQQHRLAFIEKQTTQFQSLFPYRVFYSPEILEHEKRCSICDAVVRIRRPCGHRAGEIYDGELCGRVVTKPEFLSVSLVRNPVQKYSVAFPVDSEGGGAQDNYDYSVVEYVVERTPSPYLDWDVERTFVRHPHEHYRHTGRNDPCPCESGRKYKKCCLREVGVLRPHIDFTFHFHVPEHLLGRVYPGRD